jgi:nitrogen-specific signal transduction histidine kinase
VAAVAAAIAFLLALALVVREQMWRHTAAALRADVEERDRQLRQQEQRAHMTEVVSGLAHELKSLCRACSATPN